MTKHALDRFALHLGLGARASAEPEFTGMDWYGPYSERHATDGAEGRRSTPQLPGSTTSDKPNAIT